jgi:hypothetical protein
LLSCAVALVVPLAGCENARTDPVPIEAAILLDVEGMHGGRNLWLASDGTAVVQVVGHVTQAVGGLPEKCYRVRFGKAAVTEVERLVGAHRFLDLNLTLRVGPPGGGHPEIAVLTKAGGRGASIKREDDKHPDFDPLYAHLLLLAQKLDGAELIHEGAFDWDWHPDGFPSPKEIRGWSK